jgi:hypothetical protein
MGTGGDGLLVPALDLTRAGQLAEPCGCSRSCGRLRGIGLATGVTETDDCTHLARPYRAPAVRLSLWVTAA